MRCEVGLSLTWSEIPGEYRHDFLRQSQMFLTFFEKHNSVLAGYLISVINKNRQNMKPRNSFEFSYTTSKKCTHGISAFL